MPKPIVVMNKHLIQIVIYSSKTEINLTKFVIEVETDNPDSLPKLVWKDKNNKINLGEDSFYFFVFLYLFFYFWSNPDTRNTLDP